MLCFNNLRSAALEKIVGNVSEKAEKNNLNQENISLLMTLDILANCLL